MSSSTTTTDSRKNNNIIDGKAIAAQIRAELKERIVQELSHNNNNNTNTTTPGLAVLLVGSRRDSQTYVAMKKKACAECGVASFGYDFAEDASQQDVLDRIHDLNERTDVHGILVQLPLPKHMREETILNAIRPDKDVDGLHPINVARLVATNTHHHHHDEEEEGKKLLDWLDLNSIPFPIACTPLGCLELLDRSGVSVSGKRAVVVGRSNLVGLPVAVLLMHRDATVTVVHSKTVEPERVVREADIVVVAVGRAGLVKREWIKEGAVVIDVGINSVDDATTKKGYRLVGDVDYEQVKEVASLITPVPGGVGPMTIAMLLRNTVNACKRATEKQKQG